MSMNIALIGYGKMGHEIESAAIQRGHSIVSVFSSSSPLPPASSEYYKLHNIQCCIDFSHTVLVRSHAEICSSLRIPLVEGTTGWQDKKNEILSYVKEQNGTFVYGNNFSIGAQMFFRIVRNAAQLMNAFSEYDVAIQETHHTKKKDSPSGTALTLANEILSQMKIKSVIKQNDDLSITAPHEINISSSRLGTVFGNHSVLFHSHADEIELIHRAHNRSGFALGAVFAAELTQNVSGIFSFEELVFEKSFIHH
jgi:4-hydroxy-tetrahydrodipicolinate reductase